jgi:hypothetical protein
MFAGRFAAGVPASPPAVCRGRDEDLAYRPDATGAAGGVLQRGPMRASLPATDPAKVGWANLSVTPSFFFRGDQCDGRSI